ncbi:hypothetical protein ABIF68_002288 [Bradyrhizobium japonicum]
MTETTNVLAFRQPSAVDDPLTDIVRAGARDLLAPRGSLQIPPGVVSQIPPPARQDKGLLV